MAVFRKAVLGAVLAALTFIAPSAQAQYAPSPSGEHFIMQCRGPLHLQATAPGGVQVLILHFTPAAGASGARGESLRSGECAFLDRTLRAAEPRKIRWEVYRTDYSAGARALNDQALRMVTECQSPTCVVRVPVKNWAVTLPETNAFVPFATFIETFHSTPR